MTKGKKLFRLFFGDLILLGIALIVFALFHHVLPRRIGNPYNGSDFPAPTDWFEKFPDCFTDGEIIRTKTSYRDDEVCITLQTHVENGVTYYTADLYLRYITSFQCAMASEEFATGIAAQTLTIAENNNALLAVSGDSFGLRQRSVVLRNGVLYRRAKAHQNICVLYYDGTMKTYDYAAFSIDRAIRDGAWQIWDFGPSLLDQNQKAITQFDPGIAGENPRVAIGYYEPGHYVLVAVDGRQSHSRGMTLAELARLFESLGCREAYNLDGGGSAVMTWDGQIYSKPSKGTGGRDISDIIFIAPRRYTGKENLS